MSSSCEDCKVKDLQIEQLEQKLEYALHMNKFLADECKRLNDVIKETKWKSGCRHKPPPSFPNEIWHAIFKLATESQGLAFSTIHGYEEDIHRKETSETRLSIPLVCRQWARVGTEFLYNRIVVRNSRQLYHFRRTLKHRPAYRDWCHHIELRQYQPSENLDSTANTDDEIAFYDSLQILMISLPNIRSLAVHSILPTNRSNILEMIQQVGPRLQTLHLPPALWTGEGSLITSLSMEDNVDHGNVSIDWTNLKTLSLVSRTSWLWLPQSYTIGRRTRLFIPSLRTLRLFWPSDRLDSDSLIHSLGLHANLTTLYIGAGTTYLEAEGTTVFMSQLEEVLRALPKLVSLFMEQWPRASSPVHSSTPTTYKHRSLESIVIHKASWHDEMHILGIQSIFTKLDTGELPAFKVIELRGDFRDGCIDAGFAITPAITEAWAGYIRICKKYDVALVNQDGQKLYLWKDRPGVWYTRDGIMYNVSLDGSDSDNSVDTEDSWEEDDGERPATPEWEKTDDEYLEDADDSPYVYRPRGDIRPVDDESEDEWETDDSS